VNPLDICPSLKDDFRVMTHLKHHDIIRCLWCDFTLLVPKGRAVTPEQGNQLIIHTVSCPDSPRFK